MKTFIVVATMFFVGLFSLAGVSSLATAKTSSKQSAAKITKKKKCKLVVNKVNGKKTKSSNCTCKLVVKKVNGKKVKKKACVLKKNKKNSLKPPVAKNDGSSSSSESSSNDNNSDAPKKVPASKNQPSSSKDNSLGLDYKIFLTVTKKDPSGQIVDTVKFDCRDTPNSFTCQELIKYDIDLIMGFNNTDPNKCYTVLDAARYTIDVVGYFKVGWVRRNIHRVTACSIADYDVINKAVFSG